MIMYHVVGMKQNSLTVPMMDLESTIVIMNKTQQLFVEVCKGEMIAMRVYITELGCPPVKLIFLQ